MSASWGIQGLIGLSFLLNASAAWPVGVVVVQGLPRSPVLFHRPLVRNRVWFVAMGGVARLVGSDRVFLAWGCPP